MIFFERLLVKYHLSIHINMTEIYKRDEEFGEIEMDNMIHRPSLKKTMNTHTETDFCNYVLSYFNERSIKFEVGGFILIKIYGKTEYYPGTYYFFKRTEHGFRLLNFKHDEENMPREYQDYSFLW